MAVLIWMGRIPEELGASAASCALMRRMSFCRSVSACALTASSTAAESAAAAGWAADGGEALRQAAGANASDSAHAIHRYRPMFRMYGPRRQILPARSVILRGCGGEVAPVAVHGLGRGGRRLRLACPRGAGAGGAGGGLRG